MRVTRPWFVAVLFLAFAFGVAGEHYGWPLLKSLWWSDDTYYQRWVSVFESTPGTADIVMLGDSLTEEGNWTEVLPGWRVINRGIGGDTSAGVLKRLSEVIRRNPQVVFL